MDIIELPEDQKMFTIQDSMLISSDSTKIYFCPTSISGEINISKKIRSIENSAFYRCSKITKLNFESGLDSIKTAAFYGCVQLTNIALPFGLKYIGDLAFEGCSSVVDITLPNTLRKLDFGCFYNTKIQSITIPGSIDILGDKVFYTCDQLYSANVRCIDPPKRTPHLFPLNRQIKLHVLKGLKSKYEAAEYWNEYTTIYDDLDWIYVKEIIIDKEEYQCNINETAIATAQVYPNDADASKPIWYSEDESIVYIDQDGNFIGLKEGTTHIIAKANDGTGIYNKARVSVGNTSNIEDIHKSDINVHEVARYNIYGIRITSPTRGINIVVLSDGTSYKELVK